MYIRTNVTCCFQIQGIKHYGGEEEMRAAGKEKVGAGALNQRVGCNLKRLGGAELTYPRVGGKVN
jgi:hypothetical protein